MLQSARRFDKQSRVIGVDCDPQLGSFQGQGICPIPPLEEMDLETLTNYCLGLGVTRAVPTRDEELGYWSARSNYLEQKGIQVMVSSEKRRQNLSRQAAFLTFARVIGHSTHRLLRRIVSTEFRFLRRQERSGSASKSIGLNLVAQEALEHAKGLDRPIFQPMVQGREFEAETWINSSGKCHGMLLRWRRKIIDGEAHETETFENQEWQKLLISTFEAIPGLSGHALAQVIVDPEQSLHLIEINPRLGEQALWLWQPA